METADQYSVIALALTWDGARWPARTLPPKARAFLKGSSPPLFPPRKRAEFFANDQVGELRICWVPCLKGGSKVLSVPFKSLDGKRISFCATRTVRFGDVLGVVYRRRKG
jgi:hypothetical protein